MTGGETRSATHPLSGLIVSRDRRSARDEVAGESQVAIEQRTSLYLSPLHSSTHLRHHAVKVGIRFRTIADQPLIPCCSNLASCSIFGNTSGGTAPNSPAPCGPAGWIAVGCATPQSEQHRMDTPAARTSTTTFMERLHRLSHARRLATNAGSTSAGTLDRARH